MAALRHEISLLVFKYISLIFNTKRNFIPQSSHVISLLSLQTCYMYSSTLANAHAPRPHFDMSFKHS